MPTLNQLPELSGPGLANNDVLPLADLSASETILPQEPDSIRCAD